MKIRQQKYAWFTLLCISSVLVTGCTESQVPAPEAKAVTHLPVSLNTVMVALVNQAADPLWVAAWDSPESDSDWRELERRAVQIELGGILLRVPGTGPLDDVWAGSPGWQSWSGRLREVGAKAVVAAKGRDIEMISTVGDELVMICEGCHLEYKLAMPTGGEFGELSPTASDLEDK